jgi:RNA polymerase sigma-70 factor (ECF subfamily)
MSSIPSLTRVTEPGRAEASDPQGLRRERSDGLSRVTSEGSSHNQNSDAGSVSDANSISADGVGGAQTELAPLDFDAVVAEHGPYIWRVLRRLGVRPSDVEDVWQETFIVVHRKLEAFEGRSQLRTWLSAIAVRVASDYRNRAHRRRELATDEVPDGGAAASQHEDLVEQERRALLDRLIGELKPEQREVVVLYEFAELPMQEVAEALGCPLQTAYSRLHAGRRALEQAARRESARRGLP